MLVKFEGGPLDGTQRVVEPDYEYATNKLTFTHRVIVAPDLWSVLEADEHQFIEYLVEYHTYTLVLYANGPLIRRDPYPILIDDQVTWGYTENPNYREEWRGHYAHDQLQKGWQTADGRRT